MKSWPFVILFLGANFSNLVAAPLRLTPKFPPTDATIAIEYTYSALPIDQLVSSKPTWQKLSASTLPERFTGDKVWLRLLLHNDAQTAIAAVLASGEARTDFLEFHLFRAGKFVSGSKAGDMLTRKNAPPYLTAIFAFDLQPRDDLALYIQLSNPVDIAPDFIISSEVDFAEMAGINYLLHGFFFGAILILLLYYSAVFLSTQSREVGDYLLYLLVVAVFFFARTGLLYQIISFRHAELMNYMVTPIPGLVFFTGLRFIRSFLEVKKFPTLETTLRIIQYACLLPIPVAFFSREYSRHICDWISMILGPGLLVLSIGLLNYLPKAKLFLLGWSIPLVVSTAQNFGIDTSYFMRNSIMQAAILIEFTFFAVFVGRDIRKFEHERGLEAARLESVEADIEQARAVHARLLPPVAADFPGLDIDVLYRPMSVLGGDYYDWMKLSDGRLAVLVADVTGHGLPAALDAAVVRIAFQTAASQAVSANSILQIMNTKLISQGIDRCVSAVCAVLSPAARQLEVALAGHPQIIVSHGSSLQVAGEFAPLLGFSELSNFVVSRVDIGAGDRVILCTDGVYEHPAAENADDFELLEKKVLEHVSLAPQEMMLKVVEYFEHLRGPNQADDITLLAITLHS